MEKEKKTGNAKVDDGYFHGTIRYRRREYWLDEVHDPKKIKGKWCINVEVPGVNHDPRIFTISVNEYDNEPDNDELNNKRPALFNTINDAELFCHELYFLQTSLRINCITDELLHHKLFEEMGAYIVKRSNIVIPKLDFTLGRAIDEAKSRKPAYKNKGGIFLP